MNTQCKSCIFAQHDGKQQNGCVFDVPKNLSDSFSSLYHNAVSVVDGFYKINNFKCPYGTTEEWRQSAIESGIDPEDIISIVLKMTGMSYYLVYNLDNNLDMLNNNLTKISQMNCLPMFISFIKPTTMSVKHQDLWKVLDQFTFTKWKLHNITESSLSYFDTIDMVLDTNLTEKTKIVSFWNNKYMISSDYFDRANQTLNYFLNKSAYISSHDVETISGFCFHVSAYLHNKKRLSATIDFLNNDNTIYKLYVM